MSESCILAPINACRFTGLESPHHLRAFAQYGVRVYADTFGRLRIVSPDKTTGLLLEKEGKDWRICQVYTLAEYRRQGKARQLLALSRKVLGAVRHGYHQTNLGSLWSNAVG